MTQKNKPRVSKGDHNQLRVADLQKEAGYCGGFDPGPDPNYVPDHFNDYLDEL